MNFRRFLLLVLAPPILLSAFGGCSTTTGSGLHVRDGVSYGTTSGRFRGRWWNYYERGRSFLEGGFYDQAEDDLRTALDMRSGDQLWPRTYGLHFTPEYFPQRELGIALYYQGALDEAQPLLEHSLDQQYSARAVYFLDTVRKKQIDAAGGDVQAPAFTLLSPSQGAPASGFRLTIEGEASDDHFVSRIDIGGQAVDIRQSAATIRFEKEVLLAAGQNEVPIVVEDLHGNRLETTLALNNDVSGPALSFDEVTAKQGTLRGEVYDPSGVDTVEIAGKPVELSAESGGIRSLALALPVETLQAGVDYTAKDRLGNVTEGRFALQAPRQSSLSTATRAFLAKRIVWTAPAAAAFLFGAAPVMASPLRINFPGLEEGQQYFTEEIIVNVSVSAPQALQDLTLNGAPLPFIPGKNAVTVSQRFQLAEGANDFEARARDAGGNEASQHLQVLRAASETEGLAGRLSVAFLGNTQPAIEPETQSLAEYVFDRLPEVETVQERFGIVDRSQLEAILAEQKLSEALSSKESRLALGRLIPAEAMFAGRIRADAESIEVVLEGASTETAERLTSRVEIAGPPAEIDRLIDDLGLRLVQEFPRARGIVLDRDGEKFTSDLGRLQGVRSSFKCLIYRTVPVLHPVTGKVLGEKPVQVYQGILEGVEDALSAGQILPQTPEDDVSGYDIQTRDYVQTK